MHPAAAAHPPAEELRQEHRKYFTFVNVILALTAITFVELILIILPFHGPFLFSALVLLSLLKFTAVVWWFMHLRWDQRLLTLLFLIGLTLASGTVFALIHLFEAPPPAATATP